MIFKPKNENSISPQFCDDYSLHYQPLQWYNFLINTFRFSQELLPPGNHPWSTTTSVGSISKECGWLRLDYNGLFGHRIHLSMLLCSHRRHLCLRLLLLQSRKELKFLAGGSELFKIPHLVKFSTSLWSKKLRVPSGKAVIGSWNNTPHSAPVPCLHNN